MDYGNGIRDGWRIRSLSGIWQAASTIALLFAIVVLLSLNFRVLEKFSDANASQLEVISKMQNTLQEQNKFNFSLLVRLQKMDEKNKQPPKNE